MDLIDIGISVGLFVTVFAALYGIFSQPGKITMSAQRQAALATGHTDRKTIFENPLIRPLMWLLLLIAHRLNLPSLKGWVGQTLVSAGSPKYYTPEEYIALSLFTGVVLGAVLEASYFIATSQITGLSFAVGLLIGFFLTLAQLYGQAANRIRDIGRQLPYSLDLISLAMGAGATFAEAVTTIVDESSEDEQDPLNVELRAMLAEMELGATRRRALENLSRRVPLASMQGLVASVKQAEQLGTPLSDMLGDQAELMRLNRSARAEDRAAKASIRILVPCLLLVAAVIMVVFGPMAIRYVRDGLF